MNQRKPSFPYAHINGHFDPLVLATFRTIEDRDSPEWKSKFDVWWADLGSGGHVDVCDADFLTFLTNKHEQDHFARHASCEIGLFITLILHLRFYTALSADYDSRPLSRDISGFLSGRLGRLIAILVSGQ